MATSLREATLLGEWERNGNPGFVAAEFQRNEIIWPDGARHGYALRGNTVHLTYDGAPFTGTFEGTRLRWSDGDVWSRKAGWEKAAAVSTAIPKARDEELKWGKFGESDPTTVLLRTRKYLQTKQQKHKATRSDAAIATFMGAELFRGSTQAPTHICDLTESRFGFYIQHDTSDRFYVIINNRVTSKKISVCAFWHFSGSAFHNNPSFEKLWWQFVYGNDDFRNSRFKCYPKIVKGSWALKMMVPNVPTLLGQKVPITYKRGKNFIEIDVECDNNMLASSITRVAYPIAKSLTVDQSYILQAEEEFDLPEIVFAGVRYEGIDLSKALDVDN